MSYEMQVKIIEDGKPVWKSVKCTGKDGYIYRYHTKRVAWEELKSLYPLGPREELRVIEVDEPPNMDKKKWED